MRILLLTQFYPPVLGGEERHVRTLAHELAARGHDVSVATLSRDAVGVELDGGIRVHRMQGTASRIGALFADEERRHVPPLPDPELVLALGRIVARERPEIVHAHNWLVHSFLPLKPWSHARLVLTLHDYSLVCAKKSLVYRDAVCDGPGARKCLQCAASHYGAAKGVATVVGTWTMGRFERRAVDMFVPVSRAAAIGNRLDDLGLPYTVIPNFIPARDDARDGVADDLLERLPPRYFLFAGDVRRFKGIDVLLRAHAGLRDAPALVLLGRLCADAPREYPDAVYATGPWPHGAVLAAWDRSLAGVAPSVGLEPMPTAVLEAMRSGRPVIGSRIGGIADAIVDGETGFLVPAGDADALREAMQRVADDAGLRDRMGRAAKARVAAFEADAVVPRIESVYAQLLSREAHGQPRA